MIREDGGFAKEPPTECNAGRIELWEMQLDNIMLRNQFGSDPTESWRDDTLAHMRRYRNADDFDTIHHFFARQGWIELCGHHGHLMPAFDKGTREAFGINGQPGSVGAIISEDGQNFHKRGGLYPTGLSEYCRVS